MRVSLRLYVTSSSAQSDEVMLAVEDVKKRHANASFEVEVVDVLAEPSKAEQDQISVTPTLIILSPLPKRKIISDFNDLAKQLGL